MAKPSKSPQLLSSRVPMTPRRRFLCKIEFIRSILALGGKNRELHYGPSTEGLCLLATAAEASGVSSVRILEHEHPASLDRNSTSAHGLPESSNIRGQAIPRARLAVQQHDQPLDAIVVTTLPSYPFCCHEDLLLMSRSQLVEVATLFNAHLPCTAQIDLSDAITDSHIRHCIEKLVGIIPDVPGAPKAAKSRPVGLKGTVLDPFEDSDLDIHPSPPTSPLAMRLSRKRGLSHIPGRSGLLERLEEEDEGDIFTDRRALKKPKVFEAITTPTRFEDEDDVMDLYMTPTRSLSFSTSIDTSSSPTHIRSSDMDMPIFSPLQNRGRAFALDSASGTLNPERLFLTSQSRYRSNSSRRDVTRGKRAQQIWRPMGKLHMNSVSPVSAGVEHRIPMDMF